MALKAQDIIALVELFGASRWDELHVEIDGLQLFLSTDPHARLAHGTAPPGETRTQAAQYARQVRDPIAVAPPAGESLPSHWKPIAAPNLGTFYRAPKPGSPPLVEVGSHVSPETEICLIEVMKLFTAMKAGVSGTIRQICANDSDMVEHGQTLFYVETD